MARKIREAAGPPTLEPSEFPGAKKKKKKKKKDDDKKGDLGVGPDPTKISPGETFNAASEFRERQKRKFKRGKALFK